MFLSVSGLLVFLDRSVFGRVAKRLAQARCNCGVICCLRALTWSSSERDSASSGWDVARKGAATTATVGIMSRWR